MNGKALTMDLTPKEGWPEVSVGRQYSDGGDAQSIRVFLVPAEWYKVELYGGKLNEFGVPSEKVGEFVGQFRDVDNTWRYPRFDVDKENDTEDTVCTFKIDGIREINPYDHPKVTWLYWMNEGELPDDPMLCAQLAEAYLEYGLIDHFIPESQPHQRLAIVPNLLARAIQMGYRPWKQDKDPAWGYIERMNPRVRAY